jgi:dipeptidyl aminopeptidase/acylaminoacyl peptidase
MTFALVCVRDDVKTRKDSLVMAMAKRNASLLHNVVALSALLAMALSSREVAASGSPIPASKILGANKRAVTVRDVVEMTHLADHDYFLGLPSKGHVGHFSPDGKKFVVVLRKGSVQQNRNEFSLLLFRTKDGVASPKPTVVATMSSSSNRDAISGVKWLDNRVVAFLGENPNEFAQVYTLDVENRHIEKQTAHPSAITAYDITSRADKIVFAAERVGNCRNACEPSGSPEVVIEEQSLPELLARSSSPPAEDARELYLKAAHRKPVRLPLASEDAITSRSTISFSPDGKYALIGSFMRRMPASWRAYGNGRLHNLLTEKGRGGTSPFVMRYLILDTTNEHLEPLMDAPMLFGFSPARWAQDGRSLFVKNTYLPLDAGDASDNKDRERKRFDVEVKLPGKAYRMIAEQDWPREERAVPDVEVALEEGLNSSPKIYTTNRKTGERMLLLDLNPQLASLTLGEVELVAWRIAMGREVQGALYLPPNLEPGVRYPLVVQMHGFDPQRFSMSGREDGSGFAARPLAARGFVVLQVSAAGDPLDVEYTNTLDEGQVKMEKIERAIDYLAGRGLIDRDRVGLMGFSRGCYGPAYALTHSKYHFRAAILEDGFYGGYLQYLWFPTKTDFMQVNGGAPLGEGLRSWATRSPSFTLDRVDAPVRLVAQDAGPLVLWEWFSVSAQIGKAVDFTWFPDAPHLIVKPLESMLSMQGSVDWFCFWVKGEESPSPAEPDEYVRWRALRDARAANSQSVAF